jgi:hypothetical protein
MEALLAQWLADSRTRISGAEEASEAGEERC